VSGHVLPLVGSTADWTGGAVTPAATCVLAPNPSPWTLDGTNTWLVAPAGAATALVVDPGPDDAGHLSRVERAAEDRGARIVGIVLTHGHLDHSEGARALAARLGVGIRALDPAHRLGDEGLADGDVVDAGDWCLDVVGTPGHTTDSVSLVCGEDGSLLTGDTVLGRGTSLVAWPDGRLGDYLASLQRLRSVVDRSGVQQVLPGHGPALADPAGVLDAYYEHRRARLAEVASVMESGITSVEQIVAIVYADVPREIWPAAELTVRAQVEYLASR
jgi:glyoxylase-like metal-dependent hydrolase (beta-lactamase superfamily II)